MQKIVAGCTGTPQIQYKKPQFSVQFGPRMRFLVFDFAVYAFCTPAINYEKPPFQSKLYQECGFLPLISHCVLSADNVATPCPVLRLLSSYEPATPCPVLLRDARY
eukprot:3190258-Rhodomonas_salina.6